MREYPPTAVERAMKIEEVTLRALATEITWWQAAEGIGISGRGMRRWRQRYAEHGSDGRFDRRRAHRSPGRRVYPCACRRHRWTRPLLTGH